MIKESLPIGSRECGLFPFGGTLILQEIFCGERVLTKREEFCLLFDIAADLVLVDVDQVCDVERFGPVFLREQRWRESYFVPSRPSVPIILFFAGQYLLVLITHRNETDFF